MSEHLSASYDVDIAREYGLPAAALYNKLVYLSRYTSREDGFCWRTAQELENELGITKKQQMTATAKLEEAGLIETKTTYIVGTMTRCKHFRVLSVSDKKELTIVSDKRSHTESDKRSLSVNNNKTIIIRHNNIIDQFEAIWKDYPKKQGKDRAFKAYTKARKEGVTDEVILKGIKAYKGYIAANHIEDRYVKQGGTWFYQRCWEDEYKKSSSGKTRLQDRHDYDYDKIEKELFGNE